MNAAELTQSLRAESGRLGFQLFGVTPAISPIGFSRFEEWLDSGFAGEMHYLESRKDAYRHPRSVLDSVKFVVLLGMNYQTEPAVESGDGVGRIARYAWGAGDYHDLIHARLKQLKSFVLHLSPDSNVRGVVDTAPLLEREFAQLCGLGWQAKNTMLINRTQGSWFFLSALLVDLELEPDLPFTNNHCGTCTACLDACPTDAFEGPGVLNATKCISYLTIEHRSPIPVKLRPKVGNWILGCDVCQEVCPWNRKAPLSAEAAFAPVAGHNPIELGPLFDLDDDQFRSRFRKTPLWRPKRRGILRNAAIAMGNSPASSNLESLEKGLNDPESLVRGAAAWALGQHLFPGVRDLLLKRQKIESDETVRQEIEWAIENLDNESSVKI